MIKNTRIDIRLSNTELDLIKTTASKLDMSLSHFILSVVVPYCVHCENSAFLDMTKSSNEYYVFNGSIYVRL